MAVRTRAKRKRKRAVDVGQASAQASGGAKAGAPSRWLAVSTRLGGPLLIVLVGAAMLCWSWRTWPDVLVDFGRELYVAWRLAVGETLYKDIAHFNGPLSPYVNSLWFRLLGTNLLTLALCNVVLLAGFVTLLYRLIAEVADRLAATAACLTLVTIFTFGQFVGIGNYNFVCPYSHEATHGVIPDYSPSAFVFRSQSRSVA